MNITKKLLIGLFASATSLAANAGDLTLKIYNASSNSFNVNSTLVYGDTEAAVIDAGFTKADALRIAANVLDSGKTLTTIFISQADPDYYFGAETLKAYFPDAKVLATPAVRQVIAKKMESKLKTWAPNMGPNAPTAPILPDAYTQSSFTVDGETIEIHGTTGVLAHRPYLWIPSKQTILGNVAVFGDVHAWTADTQTEAQLDAWVAQLAEMKKLSPKGVIPGHMLRSTELNASAIQFTIDYLADFRAAKANSQNSQELIDAMMKRYPADSVPVNLSIGAKVHMGEMTW